MGSNQAAVSFLTNIARAAFGLGIGATVLNSSLYTVDGGQRAVLFDRFRGVIDETVGEGTHFLIPWLQKPFIFDIRTRPHTFSSVSVEESENAVAENLENSHPACESTFGGVPENSRNLEVHGSVSVSAVAENPENSHPAGKSTSDGVPENSRNLEVHGSVSVSLKGDVFLKILYGLAAITGATAMVYAAWKIGDGVDGWKRVGFPIQLKIEKLAIWDSLWRRS